MKPLPALTIFSARMGSLASSEVRTIDPTVSSSAFGALPFVM